MICQSLGGTRKVATSSSGAVYAHCLDCTARYLRDAFRNDAPEPRPVHWFDRAKANDLPTSFVGGTPA